MILACFIIMALLGSILWRLRNIFHLLPYCRVPLLKNADTSALSFLTVTVISPVSLVISILLPMPLSASTASACGCP